MSDKPSDQTEMIDRAQVESALQFLEWAHGDSLDREWSDGVAGYYHAITILEDALDGKLRPPEEIYQGERERQMIKKSREAREQGYRAATRLGENHGWNGPKERPSLLGILKRKIADRL